MLSLSVIIPVHNGIEFIERAVKSVSSIPKNIEIVLVENGSTDDSWGFLINKFSDLNILRLEYASKSEARNIGAKFAKSNVITFLDQDDEFRLERLWGPYLEFACRGGVVIGTQDFQDDQKTLMPSYILQGISRNLPNYVPISMLISRLTFLQMGGFDNQFKLAEDFEFLTRLIRSKIPIKYVQEAFLTRNFHMTNDSHNVSGAQKELFKLLRTHAHSKNGK